MTEHEHRQRQIVAGLDGSPESAHALATAIDLARALGARITAVYAIRPPSAIEYGADYAPVAPPELDPEWRAEMTRQFREEWCVPLQDAGMAYDAVVEEGRPASVIADVAERLLADMVVVGRRGRGEVAELLLGSVSHELSHHCGRPVLLVSGTGAAQRSTRTRSTSSSVA